MKHFKPSVNLQPKPKRPLPEKVLIFGGQQGGQKTFPALQPAWERNHSDCPVPMREFVDAARQAEDRIWIIDEYLLRPDIGLPETRVDQILEWLPLQLAASDIRILTKHHAEVEDVDLKKFELRAQEITQYTARRSVECRIEIRMHLTRDHDFIHDRFAIIDDELWHFGATVGGFHAKVNAASRGWRAEDHNAIEFFQEIWEQKGKK